MMSTVSKKIYTIPVVINGWFERYGLFSMNLKIYRACDLRTYNCKSDPPLVVYMFAPKLYPVICGRPIRLEDNHMFYFDRNQIKNKNEWDKIINGTYDSIRVQFLIPIVKNRKEFEERIKNRSKPSSENITHYLAYCLKDKGLVCCDAVYNKIGPYNFVYTKASKIGNSQYQIQCLAEYEFGIKK